MENIINWIIENKDSLISNVVVTSIFTIGIRIYSQRNKIPKFLKKLKNNKGIKYLGFIFLYVLPLGTILFMIYDKTNEPTFKNISLFLIICITFIFNILMSHIISIYKLIIRSTQKNSDNFIEINESFTKVYNHIEGIKKGKQK